MRTVLLALVFVVLATPALATDGVLEINQTCAVSTGCFAGDTAGYPITIDGTAGRSYRLTSDLIVPDENTDGIKLSTSDIGIDLNNFTIIRSGCEGTSTDCTPVSGTGSGIEHTSSTDRGISVKNGSITGMGNYGVLLAFQSEVTGLRLRWNRLDGINAGTGSTVSENSSYQNGDEGISTGNGSTISGNTAFQNGGDGIIGGNGSTVSGNATYLNAGNGITGSNGSIISDNSSYENTLDGISATNGCTIRGNAVRGNDGWGLDLFGSLSAYRENTISTSGAIFLGTVDGGTNAGDNVCNGSLTCP